MIAPGFRDRFQFPLRIPDGLDLDGLNAAPDALCPGRLDPVLLNPDREIRRVQPGEAKISQLLKQLILVAFGDDAELAGIHSTILGHDLRSFKPHTPRENDSSCHPAVFVLNGAMFFTLLLFLGTSASMTLADSGPTPAETALQTQGQAVIAQIQSAVSDETELDTAYSLYLSWEPAALAYPSLQPLLIQSGLAWGQAITAAASRDEAECAAHDLNQIARLEGLTTWINAHTLILSNPGVDLPGLQNQLENCAQFQLEVQSTLNIPTKAGTLTLSVQSTIPLQATVSDSDVSLSGTSSLDYVSQTWPTQGGCTVTGVGQSGEMSVQPLVFALDTTAAFHETAESTANLTLVISTIPSEDVTIACPKGSQTMTEQMWYQGWTARRASAGEAHGTPTAAFNNLALTSGTSDMLTQSLSGSGPGPLGEIGQIQLLHVPK